jgi:predicted GNAT family N-acyltransferase
MSRAATAYEVSLVRTAAEFEEALGLRYEVFCDEQQIPRDLERDAEDEIATHVVVRDAGGLVAATGRVMRQCTDGSIRALSAAGTPADEARVGRMAVRARDRRAGLGRMVMEALEAAARAEGMSTAMLHAQVHAEPFYARCGYHRRGEEFDEVGIPHVEMVKRIG